MGGKWTALQAQAIHPAGLEADIQATPNWAWRCVAASLLRADLTDAALWSNGHFG
tara:strand:- start:39 stop:203 length:165 start_codon:yes stop_codon:yes gene_type:complete